MEKVLTSALAFAIFISSAAAEPINMTNEELDLIYAGGEIQINFSCNSAVVIQNGAEYQITEGSTLSLPDGTKVQIIQEGLLERETVFLVDGFAMQSGSGSTLLVINGATNISASVSVSSDSTTSSTIQFR